MKTRALRMVLPNAGTALLLTTAISGCLGTIEDIEDADLKASSSELVDARFIVQGLGNRCLDAGAAQAATKGSPVYVYQCNSTDAQKLSVIEDKTTHHVQLQVHQLCISARGSVASGAALELQPCANESAQRWALDGDSIRPVDNLELVVAPAGGKSANRTPFVLKPRTLEDTELLYFVAADGTDRDPTSGFKRVDPGDGEDLKEKLLHAPPHTVVVVTEALTLDEDDYYIDIGKDVTLRGRRMANHEQPIAIYSRLKGDAHVFAALGARARVTHLNIRGPWPNDEENYDRYGRGIAVYGKIRAYVDRNELFGWAEAGVAVDGEERDARNCEVQVGTPRRALVARNYIHANMMYDAGYGVSTRAGGYAVIQGNTFRRNRHAVESDYRAHSGYKAIDNLILREVPKQHPHTYTHDFDVHGEHNGFDGRGSAGVEIYRNTFLGLDGFWGHENFDLRGTPCNTSYFRFNVSLQSQGDAVKNDYAGDKLVVSDNQFNAQNPVVRLKAADFDGDGYDDLFVATGAAWYVSYRGVTPWHFLRAAPDMVSDVKFGDFDGDRRADVMAYHEGAWDVSWGGMSDWERINSAGQPFGDYLIGDFDGNDRADVLYPNGQEWLVSWGGRTPWESYARSTWRSRDLRLGDFDGDGKTDVFGVVDGTWKIMRHVDRTWMPLPVSLTNTIDGLGVLDANGDGRSDIFSLVTLHQIRVSYSGGSAFTTLPQFSTFQSGTDTVFGKFDDRPGDDVVGFSSWDGEETVLRIASGMQGSATRYSREEMR